MVLNRVIKPKTRRSKRALINRGPKKIENNKSTMFIKGGRVSETVGNVLKDIHNLKKPLSVLYNRKNIVRPFEDTTSIEFLSEKSDSSMFLFGSHSKKRPHNLIFGRLFDFHILDMLEFGIEKYKPCSGFSTAKATVGAKPCLTFQGESFEQDASFQRLQNLFIDFFRGPKVEKIRLSGIETIISFTALDNKVFIRTYNIALKKSGAHTPRVELEESGPSLDLVLRRTYLASDDLFKRARKIPAAAKVKKVKNISKDVFGTKKGRIHMQKQNLDNLQLRKRKALKKSDKFKNSSVSSEFDQMQDDMDIE